MLVAVNNVLQSTLLSNEQLYDLFIETAISAVLEISRLNVDKDDRSKSNLNAFGSSPTSTENQSHVFKEKLNVATVR